jgi:hypothetical protein
MTIAAHLDDIGKPAWIGLTVVSSSCSGRSASWFSDTW